MRPPRFWPKQAALRGLLKGLATRKPMLLFSFAGLLLFRIEDDKLLELLFQSPPRIPRSDEPTIPIPLPPVSGSTPLDVDSHFARVGREQSMHAHLVKSYHLISTTGGSLLRPIAINLRIPRHAWTRMDMRRQRGGGQNPSSGLAATFSPDDRGEGTGMPIRLAGDAGRFRRLDILVRRTTVVFPLVFSTPNNRAKLQESNNVFH